MGEVTIFFIPRNLETELPHVVILSAAKDLFPQKKGEILRPPRRAQNDMALPQNDTASEGLGEVLATKNT